MDWEGVGSSGVFSIKMDLGCRLRFVPAISRSCDLAQAFQQSGECYHHVLKWYATKHFPASDLHGVRGACWRGSQWDRLGNHYT